MHAAGSEPVNSIALMKDIDRRYRVTSGLTERRFYSIFYSRIDPAMALVLGINPGGNPMNWTEDKLASRSFYENWEHEYVDCRYAIQEPMLPFLKQVFRTDNEGVRRIPKSNLAFRRSSGVDEFKAIYGKTITQGQQEAMPFVKEIMMHVSPQVILLEGMTLLDVFERRYGSLRVSPSKQVETPIYATHRGSQVQIFDAREMFVDCLGRTITVIAIGHPSSFGSKPEFAQATRLAEQVVSQIQTN